MSRNNGWISLHRSILDHFLWTDKPFSKGQAWIDLLLLANHEDNKVLWDGKIQLFKRGTVNQSILSLSKRWKWSRRKATSFLELLESDKMITTESTTRGTTITIVNYDKYQNGSTTEGTTNYTSPITTDEQLRNTNNNDNKDNNRNNIIRHYYGEYNNVLLSDEELAKLKADYPSMWEMKLEALSEYMVSHNKTYSSHYAAIRSFIKNELARKGGEKNILKEDSGDKGKSFDIEDFL